METDLDRLAAWMQRNSLEDEQLRDAMLPGTRLGTFRKMLDGRMSLTDYFKRKFAMAFGADATLQVFGIRPDEKMLRRFGGQAWRPNYYGAHKAVTAAIREGRMYPAKDFKCQGCNTQANEYHHESYDPADWLRVVPLCRKCHINHHSGKRPLSFGLATFEAGAIRIALPTVPIP